MLRRIIAIAIAVVGTSGCLYDGKATAGLPCNVDADCSAQLCVEHVCGGPSAAGDGGSDSSGGSGSGSDGGEKPTEQVFDDVCEPGTQMCAGPNAIELCSDDGQLRGFSCEASCGMDNPVQGGCQTNPVDGIDYCWCESTNGPPSGTCGVPCSYDAECSSHESCISWADGTRTCGPTACYSCFDDGYACSWFGHNCTGAQCS